MRILRSISGRVVTDQDIVQTCESCPSMASAAAMLGLHFNTFMAHAKRLKCYKPNQSGKGMHKKAGGNPGIPLDEVLSGTHPQYHTYKLKHRLIAAGLKEHRCEECGLSDWNDKFIPIELDHIDGDRTNHRLHNLRMLCPNCHSQTTTYRSRNRSSKSAT